MFQNWMAVRTGALANIGQLLRIGKLPGFEEGAWILACPGHERRALTGITLCLQCGP